MLRFQSQLSIDNLPDEQLDSRWECVMPYINLDTGAGGIPYCPVVEEISFNPSGFENEEFRVGTRYFNLPSDRKSFGECSITLFCEQGMLPVYYLQSWRNLIFDPVHQYYYCNNRNIDSKKGLDILSSNGFGAMATIGRSGQINATSNWKKDIEIYFYGVGNTAPIAHATLYNSYPVSEQSYKLEYKVEPQRFRITCNFRYDNLVWDSSYRNMAIISSLLGGNPLGTLMDQGLTGISKLLANGYSEQDRIIASHDSI